MLQRDCALRAQAVAERRSQCMLWHALLDELHCMEPYLSCAYRVLLQLLIAMVDITGIIVLC
jgi:hypothetical protein